MDLNSKNIWNYKQNKPSLIVNDLKQYNINPEISYKILLTRGVFKWFAVRRCLIKTKNIWKKIITETQNKIMQAKQDQNNKKLWYYKGYLKAYEECRADVRKMCHSERWQAPDFDKKAQQYLKSIS